MDQNRDGKPAESRAAQFFRQNRGAQIVHLRAADTRPDSASPETPARPSCARMLARHMTVTLPGLAMGLHLFADETADLVAQKRMLFAEIG